MTNRRRASRTVRHADLRRAVEEAADTGLMEAVVSGCALIAYADGRVRPEEQRRMSALIRSFEPLRAFDTGELVAYFDEVTESFRRNRSNQDRAVQKVARLRGRGRYPELLIALCAAIAEADGRVDESEHEVMLGLCAVLELDPDTIDMMTPA